MGPRNAQMAGDTQVRPSQLPGGQSATFRVRGRHVVALAQAMWLALLPLWLAMAPVTVAGGTANCSEGGPQNRWQGQQASVVNGQRHGAQAIFEGQVLVQCTNPGLAEISSSFVFSNVVPIDGGFNDIVQIGAGNCRAPNCPGGMQYYTGWGRSRSTPGCAAFSDVLPLATGVGAWGGGDRVYKVQHVANVWQLLVDNTQKGSVPEAGICWMPRSSVWFGESWDFGDQIGGTLGNKLAVTSASYTVVENGGFVATSFNAANPCNFAASSFPFNCKVTGLRSLDIWTNR